MPIAPPLGFLSRPEASKRFNRSQRALERDLSLALDMRDADVLKHWQLLTKDGKAYEGREVTHHEVKQLIADGMSPTWYIEEAWLESEYGRKGSPRPAKVSPLAEPTPPPSDSKETQTFSRSPSPAGSSEHFGAGDLEMLRSENAFLKERLRTMESEKQMDAERNERREAKLFEQLEVKDRQISAWDEITQGITKGLATGKLAPQLTWPAAEQQNSDPGKPSASENEPARGEKTTVDPAAEAPVPTPAKNTRAATKASRKKGKKPTASRKAKASPSDRNSRTAKKHKWYETPVLKRFLSGK
ncbi:MAG: hypothetical protein WD049_10085 [Candidatus Paceibacterota bacterium]